MQEAQKKTFTEPGTVYAYCNTDYVLAGLIAEAAAGESAAQAMKQRFFDPLKLHDTELAIDNRLAAPYAHGYALPFMDPDGALVDCSRWNPSVYWTAGAIVSSAPDLLRWGRALFGGRVLSPDSLQQMVTPVAPSTDYGFGLLRFTSPSGRELIGHNGTVVGYHDWLAYEPATDTLVCVMGNRIDTWQDSSEPFIAQLTLDVFELLPRPGRR